MATAHLSKNYLENVDRPAAGVVRHWDTEVKGFVAYVQPKATTLYYQRDIRGKTKRVLLGRYPTLTVADARTAARTFDLEMRSGKAKLLQTDEMLLKDALANYLATTEATAQHMAYVKRALEFRLADWLSEPLSAISMAMIKARHAALSKDGAVMADDTMRALRTVWNAARIDFPNAAIPPCPTDVLRTRQGRRGWNNPQPKRNRPVVDLAAWHTAVIAITNPTHRGFYLFALLTACRKTEIATLEWSQIDEERRYLHLPRTKNGREHYLPLNDRHFAVLAELPRHPVYVFPDASWEKPLVDPRHEEVPGTLHSLRHTWASVAAEVGFGEDQIGRILNHAHSTRSVTNRYIHVHVDSMRPIMDAVTEEIERRLHLPTPLHRLLQSSMATPLPTSPA